MAVYISELRYDGKAPDDFVEVTAPAGIDVSGYTLAFYNGSNHASSFALGAPTQTIAGQSAYLVDKSDAGFLDFKPDWGVALVDPNGDVIQFLTVEGRITVANNGPAAGLTSTDLGSSGGSGTSFVSAEDGLSYTAQGAPSPGTIPCFDAGTLIDTPRGPCAVETLRPGDLVRTYDCGDMPVLWTRSSTHCLEGKDSASAPILVGKGALGPGRPDRDLVISPQHRILVGGAGQLPTLVDHEALSPAKALAGLRGIRRMHGRRTVRWVHFALETHQIVRSNGCYTESLLLGPMVLGRLSNRQRDHLRSVFRPGDRTHWNGKVARPCLKVREVAERVRLLRGGRASRIPLPEIGD